MIQIIIDPSVRHDLSKGIDDLVNLWEKESLKQGIFISKQDKLAMTIDAEMVRKIHFDHLRLGGAPYFVHQLEVATRLIIEDGMVDPIRIKLALFHDTYEDREREYKKIEASFSDEEQLGITLLSKLKNSIGAIFEDLNMEFLDRLVHPTRAYPKEKGQDWYNDTFIRDITALSNSKIDCRTSTIF